MEARCWFFIVFLLTSLYCQYRDTKIWNYYCPQMKFVKVMFLHVSVILSTGGVPQCMLGYHNPSRREQTPPWKQTPRKETPPCGVHAGRCGLEAGGMHPTGMQSCFTCFQRPQRLCRTGTVCRILLVDWKLWYSEFLINSLSTVNYLCSVASLLFLFHWWDPKKR